MTNDTEQEGIETIRLPKVAVDTLSAIVESETNLSLAHAKDGHNRGVFVPFIEWRMTVEPQVDDVASAQQFYTKITLDNLAFLLEDMTDEVAASADSLRTILGGNELCLAMPLDRTVDWLREAITNLQRAVEALEAISQQQSEASQRD